MGQKVTGRTIARTLPLANLSALPTANPGSGKPWVEPTSGAIIVGAVGTFVPSSHTHVIADVAGLQAAIDAKLNTSGGMLSGNLGIGVSPTSPLHISTSYAVANYATMPFVSWINTNNSSTQGHCNFRLDTTHASASTGFVFANAGVVKWDWLNYGSPANMVIREAQNGYVTALHVLAGTGVGVGKIPTCRLDVAGDVKSSGVTFLGVFTVASLPPAASNAGGEAQVTNSTLSMTAANYGATVAGGGSHRARVFCTNGVWIIA